jgi:hypothetical protein
MYRHLPLIKYLSDGLLWMRYCPCHFTWRLRTIAVVLARFVTARFTLGDGKVGINQSNNILQGYVHASVTCGYCSCCAYNGEMFLKVTLSRACADRVIQTFLPIGQHELSGSIKCDQFLDYNWATIKFLRTIQLHGVSKLYRVKTE